MNYKFRGDLNVRTTKKVVSFFWGGGEMCTLRENPAYAYEKKAPGLTLVCPPPMVNPAQTGSRYLYSIDIW